MKRKKILVLGDSLAMPRKDPGEVPVHWEDTWPQILGAELGILDYEVINASRRAYESCFLQEDFQEHVVFKHPNIVILQIGVVDGAPRIVSKADRRLFSRFFFPKFLATQEIAHRKRNRRRLVATNPLKKVYTAPESFERLRAEFLGKCRNFNPNIGIIQIPILAHTALMDEISPGYSSNISLYNSIICRLDGQFGLTSFPVAEFYSRRFPKQFLSDGYHLSVEGNIAIVDALKGVFFERSCVASTATIP